LLTRGFAMLAKNEYLLTQFFNDKAMLAKIC